MQVLADRIESYWTHLHGVGTLENSLWGFDGWGMRVWLDALTIEATKIDEVKDTYENVKESVYLRLDFYPLCESGRPGRPQLTCSDPHGQGNHHRRRLRDIHPFAPLCVVQDPNGHASIPTTFLAVSPLATPPRACLDLRGQLLVPRVLCALARDPAAQRARGRG